MPIACSVRLQCFRSFSGATQPMLRSHLSTLSSQRAASFFHRPCSALRSPDAEPLSRVQTRAQRFLFSTATWRSSRYRPASGKLYAPRYPSDRIGSKGLRKPRPLQSLEMLEAELDWRAHHNPHPIPIRTILTLLIRKYGVIPAQRHYEALILSNCSPDGSAEEVRNILKEMEAGGLDLSTSVLAAALDALAIHPQPELAADLFTLLVHRWQYMPRETQHSLVAFTIRTGQVDLANGLLNDLHASQKSLPSEERDPVPLYLYTMFLESLVGLKDYDAVIRFIYKLRDRNAVDMELPAALWSWMLQHSARVQDSWVSLWIWREWVEKMKAKPDRETCWHMLELAFQEKDLRLAESVRETIEHGGVDLSFAKFNEHDLPLQGLSLHEQGIIDKLTETEAGHEGIKPESQIENEVGTVDHTRKTRHFLGSGNMWPYFDHDSVHGRERVDPWDALRHKSRRR